MSYHVDQQLAGANRDVGYHEGDNNANRYSLWQYGSAYNSWCASASSYWAAQDGGFRFPDYCTYGWKGESYCPTFITRMEQMGVWHDKTHRAQRGALIFYSWNGDAIADHVETVWLDDGNKIITIGGNTSDGVYFRTRDRTYVLGFGELSEAGQVYVPPPPPPEKVHAMFKPALNLPNVVDSLAHPKGGVWLLHSDGRVTFFGTGEANIRHGGMVSAEDRKAFQGRTAARLQPRKADGGGDAYTIVATSGETYVPRQTH